jgi:hypothetical protein
MLDADETLDPASAPMIERLVALRRERGIFPGAAQSFVGFRQIPPRITSSGSFPTGPNYRYRGRVHETIDASILAGGGRLHKTGIRIDHSFSSDREARRRKNHWYIEILKEEIAADPSDDSRLDFLAAEYHQLEMFDEATEIAERIARA